MTNNTADLQQECAFLGSILASRAHITDESRVVILGLVARFVRRLAIQGVH